jgi:iron complex transport system substrate-binding protein
MKKIAVLLISLTLQLIASDGCEKQRIISQSPYITHTLEFFDKKKCIVGASIYDTIVDENITKTGSIFTPDKKTIESLKPDFIFSSDWTKPRVMSDITPIGTKSFILHGFDSMEQVESNLYVVGHALKVKNIQQKVESFSKEWRELASRIEGKNKKVFILTACSHEPYSFGKNTWLGNIFLQAGFDVIQKTKKVQRFKSVDELQKHLLKVKPDMLFLLVSQSKNTKSCPTMKLPENIKMIYLNGENFLHPAPVILEGLKELKGIKF